MDAVTRPLARAGRPFLPPRAAPSLSPAPNLARAVACRPSARSVRPRRIHAAAAAAAPDATPPASTPPIDHVAAVRAGLADPDAVLVAQTAPAVRVAIAEAVGLPPGSLAPGQLVAGLRRLGFKRVFDVALGADLTICEEAMELLARLQAAVSSGGGSGGGPAGSGSAADHPTPGPLPLLTSCCPGWVSLVEHSYPELIPHLSTCKSPHMMLGRVIKHHLAPLDARLMGGNDKDPSRLQVVSIMPCVRKQGEADRPWYAEGGDPPRRDVDHVLTTVEVAGLLTEAGIDLSSLKPEPYDDPLGAQSGSGVLFGTTGGVMEAALRTVAEAVSGEPLPKLEFTAVRGLDGVREAAITIRPRKASLPPSSSDPITAGAALTLPPGVEEVTVRVAVANGLGNAKKLVKAVQAGEAHYDFVEVMACPGGCLGGGGQPRSADKDALAKRQAALYALDAGAPLRRSHANPVVRRLYDAFLDHPLSPAAEEHLHTHYVAGGPEAAGGSGGSGESGAPPPPPPPQALDAALARGALADALAARAAGRGADPAASGDDGHHRQCDFCGAAVDCREEGGAK
jgi:iron-only hydrogenase group A